MLTKINIMKTYIKLCFVKTDYALKKYKQKFMHVVNIGGIVKYFKTENGAHRYLNSIGFKYNHETGYYENHWHSEQVGEFNRHFDEYNPNNQKESK